MTVDDLAYERLRRANPAPLTPVRRSSAHQFLADLDVIAAKPSSVPQRRWRPRPIAIAAFAAAAIIVTVTVVLGRPDGQMPETVTAVNLSAHDASAPLLGDPPAAIGGSARTDRLGTPLSMDLAPVWILDSHELGYLRLDHRDGGTVSFIRPTELADPTTLRLTDAGSDGWPVADIDGWLEALDPLVSWTPVTEPGRTDNATIRVFDLTVQDDAICTGDGGCIVFLSNLGLHDAAIGESGRARVWWIDQGGFAPIVIVADDNLTSEVSDIVDSLGLAPPAPHPIGDGSIWEVGFDAILPRGTVELPALGGIRMTLPQPVQMTQTDHSVTLNPSPLSTIGIAIIQTSPTGSSVARPSDVLDGLTQMGVTTTPSATVEGNAGQITVVDIAAGPTLNDVDTFLIGGDRTWIPPANGRLWLVPVDTGVLMISAGVLESTVAADEAIALATEVVPTLQLTTG